MPIEKLKAAYVPSSNTECPDLLVKGKPLILELPEPTINTIKFFFCYKKS